VVAGGLFVAFNAVAYFHAYHLTHYLPAGEPTRAPNKLSPWQRVRVLVTGVTLPRPVNSAMPVGFKLVSIRSTDGWKLEAWRGETKPSAGTVILFPGNAGSKQGLLPEAAFFRELGWTVLLVDFRGCGGSEGNVTTLGWREASDVAGAVKSVEASPVILYGQSLGAAAILRAIAVDGVRPAGIILEAPYDSLRRTVGHRFEAMRLPAVPSREVLLFWGSAQLGMNAFAMEPYKYARSVACPAIIFGGDDDPWVKGPEIQRVANAPHPPATLRIFPNGGHCGYVRRFRSDYRRAVMDWLESVR
jgi:uncharacterized protein